MGLKTPTTLKLIVGKVADHDRNHQCDPNTSKLPMHMLDFWQNKLNSLNTISQRRLDGVNCDGMA